MQGPPRTLTERLKALQLEKTQSDGASTAKEIPRKGLRKLSSIGRAILSKTSNQGKKSLVNAAGPMSTFTQEEPSKYGVAGQSEAPAMSPAQETSQAQNMKTSAPPVIPPVLPQIPQESEAVGDDSHWDDESSRPRQSTWFARSQQVQQSVPRWFPMSLPPIPQESEAVGESDWYDASQQPQDKETQEHVKEGHVREDAGEYIRENYEGEEEPMGEDVAAQKQSQERRANRPRHRSTHSSHDAAAHNYQARGRERSFRRRQRRIQKSLVDGLEDGGFNCASRWRNFNRARNPNFVVLNLEGRPMMDQFNLIQNRTPMDPKANVDRGYDPGQLRASQFGTRRQIGSGGFGQVFLVRDRKTNFPVAVKVCEKVRFRHGPWLQREVKIQSQLDHPNIVLLYGHWQDMEYVSLALEYCPNGSICDYIYSRENHIVRDERAALWTYQLASALQYLHMRNILHRDVKSENVLISVHGDAKLCDFGWAAYGGVGGRRTTFNGTVDYRAPESWNNKYGFIGYDARVDVWALGCILFEMLSGRLPFIGTGGRGSIARAIIRCQYQINPEICPMAADLIKRILVKYPERRIRPTQIMDHPWIRHCTRPVGPEAEKKNMNEFQQMDEEAKEREKQRIAAELAEAESLAWQLDFEESAKQLELAAKAREEQKEKCQVEAICGVDGDGIIRTDLEGKT